MIDHQEKQDSVFPHQLCPDTVLQSRYRIVRVLGEGGFGITYEGWDEVFQLRVAVKEYFPKFLVTRHRRESDDVTIPVGESREQFEKGKAAFLTEARTLARFQKDPNIISVSNFFEENQTAYIVMEFLEGKDLRDVLEEKGTFSFEEAFRLLGPVMNSLQNLHENGLIHRDISPSNIRILPDGRAKLMDFGASRSISFQPNTSTSIQLKPGYSPEEQYRSRGEQGPWTDVYALSATMYHMLAGFPPDDALQRVLLDEIRKPSELGADIPPEAESVLMKGLAVQSRDRYRTVREMADAFEACLCGEKPVIETSKPDWLPFLSFVPVAGLVCLYEMWKRTGRKRFLSAGRVFLAGFGVSWLASCVILLLNILALHLADNDIYSSFTKYFLFRDGLVTLVIPFAVACLFYTARAIYVMTSRKDYARYRAAVIKKEPPAEVPKADPKIKKVLSRWKIVGFVPLLFGFSGMHIGKIIRSRFLKTLGMVSLCVSFLLLGTLLVWIDAENNWYHGWTFSSRILTFLILLLGTGACFHTVHLTVALLSWPAFFRLECERTNEALARFSNLGSRDWRKENGRWRIWTQIPFVGGIGLIIAGKRAGIRNLILQGAVLLAGNLMLTAICVLASICTSSLPRIVQEKILLFDRYTLYTGLLLLWIAGIYLGSSNRFSVLKAIAEKLGPYYSFAEKEIAESKTV